MITVAYFKNGSQIAHDEYNTENLNDEWVLTDVTKGCERNGYEMAILSNENGEEKYLEF